MQPAPALSLSLISKARVSVPSPCLYQQTVWRCRVVALTICGDRFHFDYLTPIAVFLSSALKLLLCPSSSPGWWGCVPGDFPLSSSLLGVQVLPHFLSYFFCLLSFVLPSFVTFFLPYQSPEVFCQRSANLLC